jgi:hypothetical protein
MSSTPVVVEPVAVDVISVETPPATTDESGHVFICRAQFKVNSNNTVQEAVLTLIAETGGLRVTTLGHSAEIYIGQLLGGLVSRIHQDHEGVPYAQTH